MERLTQQKLKETAKKKNETEKTTKKSIKTIKTTKTPKKVIKKPKPTMVEKEAKEIIGVSSQGRQLQRSKRLRD